MNNLVCQKRVLIKSVDCLVAIEKDTRVIQPEVFGSMLFVPEGIRIINSFAFDLTPKIKTVILPASVRVIKKNAFYGIEKVIFNNERQLEKLKLDTGWDNGIDDVDVGNTIQVAFARVIMKVKEIIR